MAASLVLVERRRKSGMKEIERYVSRANLRTRIIIIDSAVARKMSARHA